MKVAFLTNIVSPYRAPVFRHLAATPGWQLRVFVSARTEFDRTWDGTCDDVDVAVTRSWSFKRRHVSHVPVRTEQVITRHVPIGLWGDLSRFRPDVVITHELGPRSLIASLWCWIHRRDYVVWSYQSRAMGSARGGLRAMIRRFILRRAAAVVGMGTQAREVLEHHGVAPGRIVDAPNSTDEQLVSRRVAELRADGTVHRVRAEIGGGRRIAVVSGRFVRFKGIAELIGHWRAVPEDVRDGWRLVFVGDGPLAPVVASAADVGVVSVPTVPMADVSAYYAAADLHVFGSLADAWGLTVNEAMLCGVPSLCSIHAGCADDLIDDGVDGLLYDPQDHDAAVRAITDALSRDDLAELGARAEIAGRRFTTARLANGFREAVHRAVTATREAQPSIGEEHA